MSKSTTLSLFIAAAVASPCVLSADKPVIDEEVVTVASHQPLVADKVGSAITVIDQSYLQQRKPLQIVDILRDVPGLAVSASGVRGSQTDLRVRGAESNHVLVLLDGIEINDAAQGDAFNWAHLTSADVARIEIIRGPQSALWGSEAVAGVISITTKRAADGKTEVSLFSEVGSFASRYVGGSVAAAGEGYHYRLSADRISTDGDNISRQGDERDGYRNYNIHFTSGYQLNDAVELSAVARQTVASNQFDDVSFVTGLPEDADNFTDTRQKYFRLQADVQLLDGLLQQRYAYNQSKHANKNFNAGIAGTGSEARKRQLQLLNTLNWWDNNQAASLLLEREEQDFSQRGPLQFGLDPNQDRQLSTNSAALEYRISPTEALTLAGSVRYDNNSDFDSATTKRAEVVYRFNDAVRLRSNYGSAVKNPTLSERFGFFTNFIGNPDLQPEEVKSWELGADFELGSSTLSLTYFDAELEDEINGFLFDATNGGFTARNGDGISHREGAELSFAAPVNDNVSLQASYTYTDATQPGAVGDVNEVRRPRHIASLNLSWQISDALDLLFNTQYNGGHEDDDFSSFPATRVDLENYTLVNTTVNYQLNPSVELYARLENLLNEQYEDVLGFQTLDRGGYVGVRLKFDR